MEIESLFLLDVLKSFIQEEKLNFDTNIDLSKLLQLTGIHGLTGVLGYVVIQNPSEKTEGIIQFLKKTSLASIANSLQRIDKANRFVERLNEAGIDHMVFKGYIVRNYYPVPELRSFGDIDILIKPEAREKCHKLLLELEYDVKTDWEPVYSYYKEIEYYELHTELMEIDVSEKADYKGYFKAVWEHTKQVSAHTYEPEPEFHFIYLLTHIAKHICGSGAGIRMYLDLALFIKHFGNSIDWVYIGKELDNLKLTGFANMALTVVERYFCVKSPLPLHKIEEDIFQSFMEYTMAGGVFGHFGRDSGLISLKNSSRNDDNISRTNTIIRRLFPPAATIESRYTYLQGNHWLLPVAWVHRILRTREKWDSHTREMKSIISTDPDEVIKLRKIYQEIGLGD